MGPQRIVLGVDFSAPAVDGMRWVAHHFAPQSELIMAHVVDPAATPVFSRLRVVPAEIEAEAERLAEESLGRLAPELEARSVRTVVRTGRAHEELAAIAEETGADVVAVGPHGDRPRVWKRLGTTADRLVRIAVPSVLVVANPIPRAPRRLLVALDGGPATGEVLEWTRSLAAAYGARVTALHVIDGADMSRLRSAPAGSPGGEAELEAIVDGELRAERERWLEAVTSAGVQHDQVDVVVTGGRPSDLVVETARAIEADLIVLGRRGTGRLIPAVLGSTVAYVLHGAPCPVLVVTEVPSDWTEH